MKQIIDKITNKDRLIKLYGCSECNSLGIIGVSNRPNGNDYKCDYCNGKGYTINRDSQVLDIVDLLLKTRDTINIKAIGFNPNFEKYPAQALIKLIELAYDAGLILIPYRASDFKYAENSVDKQILDIISCLPCHEKESYLNLLAFCNHHKIDIWQSVTEILEDEGDR